MDSVRALIQISRVSSSALLVALLLAAQACDRDDLTDGPKLAAAQGGNDGDGDGEPPPSEDCMPPASTPAKINEVMVENTATLADASGAFPPGWIEIFNPTEEEINLGGVALSDDLIDARKWLFPCIPESVLPPGGFLVVFADGDADEPDDLHASFVLDPDGFLQLALNGGSELFFFDASQLGRDESAGRVPDGSGAPVVLEAPTPRASNSGGGGVPPEEPAGLFIRGDGSSDGRVNVIDMVAILGFLFRAEPVTPCLDRLDVDDDGDVDLVDPISIGNALFAGGPAIRPPFPQAGTDPTVDDLPCPP
jgi:hypothetical protein